MKLYFVIPKHAEVTPANFSPALSCIDLDGNRTLDAVKAFTKLKYAKAFVRSQYLYNKQARETKLEIVTTLCIPVGRPRKASK